MKRLDGKTAFITGGARGIGAALATGFAAEGARVVIADIDLAKAQETAASLGESALAVRCDVRDRASIGAALAETARAFGGTDILVNNAARHQVEFNKPPTRLSEDQWRTILDTNIMGVVNCSTLAAEEMRKRGGGVILNITSVAGYEVDTGYGVTKTAVRGLTLSLAQDLAEDGIRVVSIAPGLIDSETVMAELPREVTDMFINERQLIKRQGRTADIVGPALMLCSDEGAFITGETLLVGGGYGKRV
ncbi:MAG: SDR family NAD(P)-dependent oxidoreductase [Sphingobium phenoxybenzoativorans]